MARAVRERHLEHRLRQIDCDRCILHVDSSSPELSGVKATLALDAAQVAGGVHFIIAAVEPQLVPVDPWYRLATTLGASSGRSSGWASQLNVDPFGGGTMEEVATHYYGKTGDLAQAIAAHLRETGRDPDSVTTADLAIIDEFHIGGRPATLNVGVRMHLQCSSRVLDIGSGLGGPARTLAETYGCHVTGIDLTRAFCEAGTVLSKWVGLADRVDFQQGDATDLPFADDEFDAAMTIHAAMNIPEKDKVYSEARRVLKPSARFVVYDVLQGEGGNILFPVPWARDASISHLATPDQMESLLTGAGFRILETEDSSDRSLSFFAELAPRMMQPDASLLPVHPFLGRDFAGMVRNMLHNLQEGRIRTVTYVCEA